MESVGGGFGMRAFCVRLICLKGTDDITLNPNPNSQRADGDFRCKIHEHTPARTDLDPQRNSHGHEYQHSILDANPTDPRTDHGSI